MATAYTTMEQLSSDDKLCKKILHELLKNQSVASWAASAVTTLDGDQPLCLNPRRGHAIVGRNGSDSKPEKDTLSAAPQLDELTIGSIVHALSAANKNRHESDCGSDTSSEFSTISIPANYKLERSMSVPSEKYIGFNGMNMDRYKTELCRQYQETGFCKYGAKCQFAHGHSEIRNVSRHPRHKSEMCRTYHTTGLCPYGRRCHFIHDEDEAQLKMISAHRHAIRHSSIGRFQRESKSFNPAVGSFSDTCMGSVGDTPPSSLNSSPAPSPTPFLPDERIQSLPLPSPGSVFVQPPPGFCVPTPPTAPAVMGASVFDFKDIPTPVSSFTSAIPSPINFATSNLDPMQSLAAGLLAATPSYDKDMMNDCFSDFYMPYSTDAAVPVNADSDTESNASESAMDTSRKPRLPVFSQLAVQ